MIAADRECLAGLLENWFPHGSLNEKSWCNVDVGTDAAWMLLRVFLMAKRCESVAAVSAVKAVSERV